MKRRCFALLFTLVILITSTAMAQIDVSVIQPSPDEALIAPGRDFYVIAKLNDPPEEQPESLSVKVLRDGVIYREVRLVQGSDAFKTDYELLTAFNTEFDQWLMPELIFNPNKPESLSHAWNKCYYRDGYIVAVITGGLYHDYIKHVNEDGSAFKQLYPGIYEVEISAAFPSGESASSAFPLELGTIRKKTLARFSPANHFYNVIAHAQKNDLRVFNDLFPGYWSPPNVFAEASTSPYFSEIKPKWQFADGIEYVTGEVYLYVYNITATCASQAVEIGILQATGAFGSGRVYSHYYDIGEPELHYIALDGKEVALQGEIVPFSPNDTLAFCRAEITNEIRDDNVTQIYQPETKDVDLDLSDGVGVAQGDFLTVLGVVSPFQNEHKDIVPLDDNSYQAMNRTSKIEYEFIKDGERIMFASRDVTLARYFAQDWQNNSIYEFSHTFDLTDFSGEIKVSAKAVDSYGNPVPGGEETFLINVLR